MKSLATEIHDMFPTWERNGDIITGKESFNDYEEDYIEAYLIINGVIEIEKLLDLLVKEHQIELTIEELKTKIENMDDLDITNNLIYLKEMSIEMAEKLNQTKRMNKRYKIVQDIDKIYDEEEENHDEIIKIGTKYNLKTEIIETIRFFISVGSFNKRAFDEILKKENIELLNKKELYRELESYSFKVPQWILNGYKKHELEVISKKVGRNELCPCGSGKKYKQCCGK